MTDNNESDDESSTEFFDATDYQEIEIINLPKEFNKDATFDNKRNFSNYVEDYFECTIVDRKKSSKIIYTRVCIDESCKLCIIGRFRKSNPNEWFMDTNSIFEHSDYCLKPKSFITERNIYKYPDLITKIIEDDKLTLFETMKLIQGIVGKKCSLNFASKIKRRLKYEDNKRKMRLLPNLLQSIQNSHLKNKVVLLVKDKGSGFIIRITFNHIIENLPSINYISPIIDEFQQDLNNIQLNIPFENKDISEVDVNQELQQNSALFNENENEYSNEPTSLPTYFNNEIIYDGQNFPLNTEFVGLFLLNGLAIELQENKVLLDLLSLDGTFTRGCKF